MDGGGEGAPNRPIKGRDGLSDHRRRRHVDVSSGVVGETAGTDPSTRGWSGERAEGVQFDEGRLFPGRGKPSKSDSDNKGKEPCGPLRPVDTHTYFPSAERRQRRV